MKHNPCTCKRLALWLFALSLPLGSWLAWLFWPVQRKDMWRTTVLLRMKAEWGVRVGKDWVVLGASKQQCQGAWQRSYWWRPGGNLLLTSALPHPQWPINTPWPQSEASVKQMVQQTADSLKRVLWRMNKQKIELDYYLRSHGVIDEGYDDLAHLAAQHTQQMDSLTKLKRRLQNMAQKPNMRTEMRVTTTATWRDKWGKEHTIKLPQVIRHTPSNDLYMWIVSSQEVKKSVCAGAAIPFFSPSDGKRVVVPVLLSPSDKKRLVIIDDTLRQQQLTLPALWRPMGAPVFSSRGVWLGVVKDKEVAR